ncbi:Holliday junction resolvase RecU [Halalkalibacter sp. APA_J-10(15)]|uniref:Holliday junction resolvase RecU n=1 Tax=unclassified Halalkalibacter TaxID=2893063 RepID=UPI001FF26D8B|nr:Holliday junction resolvase RecU [Halalkalibacter sp. APA_J-10(15)]MCK0472074.1 Holliday junction resolvase RecU [Halalkalibacter sp. APA_J-10(15)]
MAIHYPNGKRFNQGNVVNNASKKRSKPTTLYSNRGMTLEDDLNMANQYYLADGRAIIHKKPTPVQIVHVDYPKRSAAVIKEAYFKQASTTDYNGVYRGRYIDFEAKETKNKSSFPLSNFHEHQVDHMEQVIQHDGIAFVILRFSFAEEIYLLEAKHLITFYRKKETDRKSIRKKDIEIYGHLIKIGYHPRIDYLEVIDSIYFMDES